MAKPRSTVLSAVLALSTALWADNRPVYPIMRLDDHTFGEHHQQYLMQERAHIDPDVALRLMEPVYGDPIKLNLSSYQSYPVAQRNQGGCGNCWTWGTSLAAEIMMGVAGTRNALSVQHFSSNYTNVCCGGNASTWASWYNSRKFFVPLSNANAAYKEGNTSCGGSTAVPASSISTTPNHPFKSLTCTTVPTTGIGTTQAIANIKNLLLQNKPVLLSYFLNSSGWTAFYSFWSNQQESVVWNPDQYDTGTQAGGHLICIIGYDDNDQTWLAANSWGTTSGRPNGLFRIKQNMSYDNKISGYTANMFEALAIEWTTSTALSFVSQPQSQTVKTGSAVTFSAAASGGTLPYKYQWMKDGGSIIGATSTSYTLSAATLSDAGNYSVTVTDASNATITSQAATLTVTSSALAFATQPQSQSVKVGSTAKFSASMTGGTPPYTYQWNKDGSPITGATSASYTIATAALTDAGSYTMTAADAAGASLTSQAATLTVTNTTTPLALASQPQSQSVTTGSNVRFSVSATGGTQPYTYQWKKNSSPITGATSASYSIAAVALSDAGGYSVTISDATQNTITSQTATLTVTDSNPPSPSSLIQNGGFELGNASWQQNANIIGNWPAQKPFSGSQCAWMGGTGKRVTENLSQTVTIPASAKTVALRFQLHVDTAETSYWPSDYMRVLVKANTTGYLQSVLATYTNRNASGGYSLKTLDLTAFKGKTIQLTFQVVENSTLQTSFVIDDVTLTAN